MRFLGIDLGTGSLKVATVDEEGRERAAASVAYAIDDRGWIWLDFPDIESRVAQGGEGISDFGAMLLALANQLDL